MQLLKRDNAIEAAIHQVADASANAYDQCLNLWQAHSYAHPFAVSVALLLMWLLSLMWVLLLLQLLLLLQYDCVIGVCKVVTGHFHKRACLMPLQLCC